MDKIKRHIAVIQTANGIDSGPLKQWLRDNPSFIPNGLDPDTHTSHQLRNVMVNNGWHMEILKDRVLLILPDKNGSIEYAIKNSSTKKASQGGEIEDYPTRIYQMVKEIEDEYNDQLQLANSTIAKLEAELKTLREEIEGTSLLTSDITDEILRERLKPLEHSSLDTMIREAGVVLEDRLRKVAGPRGIGVTGARLVDVVMNPDSGVLIFSEHNGEQQGAQMLFRGAIQFIRNPPMHNLIEYEADKAQSLLKLIDSLLKLLSEPEPTVDKQVYLSDVQRMLTRIPIPNGQIELYTALYKAGRTGLTSNELVKIMNRTRSQLAGVLGALGARTNGTEGLQGKGGIETILEIKNERDGNYRYIMRPILKQAIEMEGVISSQ